MSDIAEFNQGYISANLSDGFLPVRIGEVNPLPELIILLSSLKSSEVDPI